MERPLYHTAVRAPASLAFKSRLLSFQAMQARCTQGVGDWTKFYMSRHAPLGVSDSDASVGGGGEEDSSAPAPASCRYLLWMPPLYAGLGNRMLALVSTFVYALLTDRALLVGPSEVLAQLMCNPFGEETQHWRLQGHGFRTMYQNIKEWQPRAVEFAARIKNGTVWDRRAAYVDLKYKASYEDWKFFCSSVQEALKLAKFVGFHTDEYTVPGFYFLPAYKAALEEWFPDARPFLHSSRFLLHPANYIWQRITRAFHSYLSPAKHKVGIQVRTFYKQDAPTGPRVLECAVNVSHALPPLFRNPYDWQHALMQGDERASALLRSPPTRRVAALVTSLGAYHFRYLQNAYNQRETTDGTLVALHSQGHEGQELVGDQGQYERAMHEMWLLSFTDTLLVSDASSFGYVAAGISGVRPFSMNIVFRPKIGLDWYKNGRPVCAPSSSSEPCYLAPPKSFQCPGEFRWTSPLDAQFGLQRCANIGIGLEVAAT